MEDHQRIKGVKKKKTEKKRSRDEAASSADSTNKHANASRKSQFREAKTLRKAAKPDWELVEEAKRIYNVVKPNDKALVVGDRETLVQDLLKLIKGRAAKLVLKHDASRIVQTCVKHGTPQQRQEVIEELKDHLLALTKSRYGKFLAAKLFVYGSKEQRLFLINALRGKARKMIKQKDSAEVLETAFSEVMNSRQRQRVLFEIYVPELSELPDSEAIPLREVFAQGDMLRNNRICDDLQKLTDMWVQKEMLKNSVVHAVLWEWVQCVPDTRREALIQTLRDLVVHFAHTAAGSKVAHYLVSQGTAKDRKLLIKSIKPNVVDLAIDEYGVWPLVRIVDCVDDTKLVSDAVLKPLLAGDVLGTLLTHRWASLVFLQVFSPTDKHYLAPDQLALMAPAMVKAAESKEMVSTSKKPMEVRQKELLEVLVGPLVNYYISEMNLANLEEDYGEDKPLNNKYSCNVLFELLALPSHDVTRAALFDALSGFVERNPTCLEKFHTSRLLKRLVKHSASPTASASLVSFVEQLWQDLSGKGSRFLLYMLRTKGAGFVALAFLENERLESEVRPVLAPLKKKIADMKDSAAAKIILQKL